MPNEPRAWRVAALPSLAALGIALPLTFASHCDQYLYDFRAIGLLNSGLLLRVIAEPADRMGHGGRWADLTLVASSALQLAAIAIIVAQIWGRVTPKPMRRDRSDGAAT